MHDELDLRRKWTFRAHGRQVVFAKKPREKTSHVLLKAFLWALYLPEYPDLTVEVPVGDRYKPDVVALGPEGLPTFWGEAGHVGSRKLATLLRRYRHTHFALARWGGRLDPFVALVEKNLDGLTRDRPVDLLSFPADSAERFIRADGEIRLASADLARVRLGPGAPPLP